MPNEYMSFEDFIVDRGLELQSEHSQRVEYRRYIQPQHEENK